MYLKIEAGLVGPTGIITGHRGLSGQYDQYGHGHFFSKKTFHRPTYCNHCSDLLWGLIGQGCICEGKLIITNNLSPKKSIK